MSASKQNVFVFGASGHAKVVMDVIEKQNTYSIIFIADDSKLLVNTRLHHYEIKGGLHWLLASSELSNIHNGIVAIGDNQARAKISQSLVDAGIKLISAIHPAATIGFGCTVGAGSVVMAGCVVNPDVQIGDGVIINTGASIDHDCVVGDYVHIAPGCHLCGNVAIGNGSFIGAGTIIIPGITVGANVTIGAGATITRDIPDNAKVVGSPGRQIQN